MTAAYPHADHLTAVRIDPDGTVTDLTLPGATMAEELSRQVGGHIEYAYYGRQDDDGTVTAVCAVVHETGLIDGLDANPAATAVVEQVRGGALSYRLHGPVVLTGYDPRGRDLTSLPESVRAALGGA